MESKILEILRNHKAVRKFKAEEISLDVKNKLEEAFILSPTAQGMQACSMIEVKDKILKEELAKISGQEYTKNAPLVYIFIVDYYKNMKIKDENLESLGYNHLLMGQVDSMIAAQSVHLVAEELGLCGFYSASILRDSEKLIELLELPKFTYPVIGLCLGYPNETPMKKPRLDKKYRVFENKYKKFEDYKKEFSEYDEELSEYIDSRNPNRTVGKFTEIIKEKYSIKKQDLESFRKQAFEEK